ncbi:MAG: hypothetical protein Q4G50_10560 [Corynebacterium sp.]|uniref:hypothetical protein n=1 Tax=Corynebacterium sp. TaxID=1720 RepID=UPI0026E11404|nr:hypothetical protein [Corynebacterium sp.]MDO5670436.1 hypothetical protein [Corynebacterium sp.]
MSETTQPRKDHRATVQAHALRMSLADSAIRFGATEPSLPPRRPGILFFSAVVASVALVVTIGAAVVIQML